MCLKSQLTPLRVCIRQNINAHWVDKNVPNEHKQIDDLWAEKMHSAQEDGKILYNAPLCSLESFEMQGDQLILNIGKTSYRDYSIYRSHPHLFQKDESPNPLGTQVIPVIEGDYIILARRAANLDVNPNKWFAFGGFVEPEKDIDSLGNPDIFACAKREFSEETSIDLKRSQIYLLGIAYDLMNPHPECIFTANLSHAEGDMLFKQSHEEYSNLHKIFLNDLPSFLETEQDSMTATTIEALMLLREG